MANISPQMAIADVLLEHSDQSLVQILEKSEVPLSPRQAEQILLDAVRRHHVLRTARSRFHAPLYNLTLLGRAAAPLICSAKAILRYHQTRATRKPRSAGSGAFNLPPPSSEIATMPKHLLRALVFAAKDSGKEVQGELREAIEIALREVA